MIEYIHNIERHEVFPQVALQVEPAFHAWLDRQASYPNYIMQVIEVHLRYLSGALVEDAHASIVATIDSLDNRNYRYTTHLLKELKAQGYMVLYISGLPHHLVEPFARLMGFHR